MSFYTVIITCQGHISDVSVIFEFLNGCIQNILEVHSDGIGDIQELRQKKKIMNEEWHIFHMFCKGGHKKNWEKAVISCSVHEKEYILSV